MTSANKFNKLNVDDACSAELVECKYRWTSTQREAFTNAWTIVVDKNLTMNCHEI